MKPLVYVLVGAVSAAALVIACSDDSPGDADAAACDCPAAEKPITASRLVRMDGIDIETVSVGGGAASVICPAGGVVITGGCYTLTDPSGSGVSLSASGPLPASTAAAIGWQCEYGRNTSGSDATVRAQVTCLMP